MKRSEIYLLAAKILVLDDKPGYRDEFIRLCQNESFDWIDFVDVCSNNLVLPLIYLKFHKHGIMEFIPEEVEEHLAEIYELNKTRNHEIIRQIKSIVSILNENDIYPVFLKGSGNLIDNLYTDIGERLMGDIDFLVPEKDYHRSIELMLNNGYRSMEDSIPWWVKDSYHYLEIYHPDYITGIEIHRAPNEYGYKKWFNQNLINNEKKGVEKITGCYVPSINHRIIHNFAHSQLFHHGYLFGVVLLKEIYDLYLLSKHYPLIKVLPKIKKKSIAIAYFSFARFAFGLDKDYFNKKGLSFFILQWKQKHCLNSEKFNEFIEVVGDSYSKNLIRIRLIPKLFYSSELRRKVVKKLCTREYYVSFFRKKSSGDEMK